MSVFADPMDEETGIEHITLEDIELGKYHIEIAKSTWKIVRTITVPNRI